ncbi:uncharacterized protein TNCV_2929311 [Trichonephila clavipes]|nr:uncharacterized protein TNCV_2929311 [Trichonephila clavipes]
MVKGVFASKNNKQYSPKCDQSILALKSVHLGGGQGLPTSLPFPPTSQEDLRLDDYLEYLYAAKALYIYKDLGLLQDSNPGPTAKQTVSLTTIPNGGLTSILQEIEKNQTCFQCVEEWSEINITGNNSFQLCFLTSSQVNWVDIENCVEFLSKEMSDIKINVNCLKKLED